MRTSKKSMQLERIVKVLREAGLNNDNRRAFIESYMKERRMERLVTEENVVGLGVVIGLGYLAALKFLDNLLGYNELENIPALLSPMAIPGVLLYIATRSKYERKLGKIQDILENNRMNKENGYNQLLNSAERIEGLDSINSIFH